MKHSIIKIFSIILSAVLVVSCGGGKEEEFNGSFKRIYGASEYSIFSFTKFRIILEYVMGLETHSIVEIKERFHKEGRSLPNMYWQQGTLWIDTEDTDDLRSIKDVMESEVLNHDLTVDFNLLKATEREPWDQWAMDIVEK